MLVSGRFGMLRNVSERFEMFWETSGSLEVRDVSESLKIFILLMYRTRHFIYGLIALLLMAACQEQVEHTAPAIRARDSVAMMTSYGVNTLISDSGVIKYRIRRNGFLIKAYSWSSSTTSFISTVIYSATRLITLTSSEYGNSMVV